MGLEEKTRKIKVRGGREITVVVEPLTPSEARQMFCYRPYDNGSESRFGGNELMDDVALILNGLAERCGMCEAPTRKNKLSYILREQFPSEHTRRAPTCPDCDGRAEYNGMDPRVKILPYKFNMSSDF